MAAIGGMLWGFLRAVLCAYMTHTLKDLRRDVGELGIMVAYSKDLSPASRRAAEGTCPSGVSGVRAQESLTTHLALHASSPRYLACDDELHPLVLSSSLLIPA